MSTISEATPLLSQTRDVNRDRLFAEDSDNPYQPRADYRDPHWMTRIQYHRYDPIPDAAGETFPSREDMLEDGIGTRLEDRGGKDYSGFRKYPDRHSKLKNAWEWLKYKITAPSPGTLEHELYLQSIPDNLRHLNYSVKPSRNFNIQITPKRELRETLGMAEPRHDYRLWAKSTWAKNGPNGLKFIDESGKEIVVHDAVTSSNDRTSEKMGMMRAIDDFEHTGEVANTHFTESIAYTGRPDTREKAIEQIEFMFQREFDKGVVGKGITEKDGVYEFTYVVNNLMSPIGPIGLFTFDELASIKREGEILEQLSQEPEPLKINGHQVRVKPIYFNQMFNQGLYYSALASGQVERNAKGYEVLLDLARKAPVSEKDRPLLDAAIHHLENPTELLPEQEIFYRDLIAKLIKLPIVFHCKSSTDRTIIAGAISMALQNWRNTNQEFPIEHPHLILESEPFKELYAANVMSGHQVTRVSRTAQGVVKDHVFNERQIGMQWTGNPVPLRLMPERYKKDAPEAGFWRSIGNKIFGSKIVAPSYQPWFIGTLKSVMRVANWFFSWATDYFSKKLTYYEKAYPNLQFNTESPYIKERSLFKPPGMIV